MSTVESYFEKFISNINPDGDAISDASTAHGDLRDHLSESDFYEDVYNDSFLLQLELTRLIGKKELTFGCIYSGNICIEGEPLGGSEIEYKRVGGIKPEIINHSTYIWSDGNEYIVYDTIGHPATLSDFHRWMNDNGICWLQDKNGIEDWEIGGKYIPYDSSKDLLDQDEETLKQIISIINQ